MRRIRLSFLMVLVLGLALPALADAPPPASAPEQATPAPVDSDTTGLLQGYGQIWFSGIQEAEWAPFFMTPVGPPQYLDAYSWGFVRFRHWFMAERYGWGWPPNPSYQGWGFDSWYGGWYGWMPNGQPAGGWGLNVYAPDPSFWYVYCPGCYPTPTAAPVASAQAGGTLPVKPLKTGPGKTGLPAEEERMGRSHDGGGTPAGDADAASAEKPRRKWFSRVPPEERVPMDGSGLRSYDPWAGSGKSASQGRRTAPAPRPSPPARRPPPPPQKKVS